MSAKKNKLGIFSRKKIEQTQPEPTPVVAPEPDIRSNFRVAPTREYPNSPNASTYRPVYRARPASFDLQSPSRPTPNQEPRPEPQIIQNPPVASVSQTPQPIASRPVQPPTIVTPPPAVKQADTNISISISVPKIHVRKPHLPKLPYKKIGIVAAAFIVIAGGGYITYHSVKLSHLRHLQYEEAHAAALANVVKYTKPNFTPLVPTNKPSLAQVGQGADFDGTKDTYSYDDTLDGAALIVSEQPIPANFTSAQQAINTIAKSLSATTPLPTNQGTAYLDTDSKTSAQTVVYAINGVLMFFQSGFTHPNSDWVGYLNALD